MTPPTVLISPEPVATPHRCIRCRRHMIGEGAAAWSVSLTAANRLPLGTVYVCLTCADDPRMGR